MPASSAVSPATAAKPVSAGKPAAAGSTGTAATGATIDAIVGRRLAALGLRAAQRCSDAEFLHRASLDLTGALPPPDKAREFLADPSPSPVKRAKLVEWLFSRPEFADYWAMRWSDTLRIKSEFPSNLWPNAVQAYHGWLRDAFAADRPFDELARELLLTTGSNFRQPPVNFYRALPKRTPEALAAHVALTLLGVRLHPGTPESEGFAGYFTNVRYKQTGEWKEEIVFFGRDWPVFRSGATNAIIPPSLPGEKHAAASTAAAPPAVKYKDPNRPTFAEAAAALTGTNDGATNANAGAGGTTGGTRRRKSATPKTPPFANPKGVLPQQLVADWLTTGNGEKRFAANIANRTWAALFGRGITHPVDDVRAGNPPADPDLLAHLAARFREGNYRLRPLLRAIVLSETYQRSAKAAATGTTGAAAQSAVPPIHGRSGATTTAAALPPLTRDPPPALAPYVGWARRIPRRLEAEVLADALGALTGAYERLWTRVPEPFAFWPDNFHAVQNPDASVTTTLLDTFGRPGRDTAYAYERDLSPSMAQALFLLNSRALDSKLEKRGGTLERLAKRHAADHSALADELWLTLLSRFPTPAEKRRALRHLDTAAGTTAGAATGAASGAASDAAAQSAVPPIHGRSGAAATAGAAAGAAGTAPPPPLEATRDLAWALINTKEFLYIH
jgi:hypothetical protein